VQVFNIIWNSGTNFVFTAVPLFILMGQLVSRSGIGEDLYDCVHKWAGRIPGGLAVTAVIASAGFGAITGVSAAAVSTMGSMILPEMKKYGYDMKLGAGSLSAGGVLAILIPPSLLMVVVGLFTETSIGDLFMAGVVPALILTTSFCVYILGRCALNPSPGPPGPKYSWREKFESLSKLTPVLVIITVVLGGMYSGAFTPTEAAAVGSVSVLIIGLVMGRLNWDRIKASLHETTNVSGMIFVLILGGYLITQLLVYTELVEAIVAVIRDISANHFIIILVLIILYLVLGAVLSALGMMLLTLPFVFPIILSLGFDRVWFGVFLVIMTEVALLTPPIGVNVFILNKIAPDIPLGLMFRGVTPFVVITLMVLALLVAFPQLVLWLPQSMH
jgi:tripartite ATP-independent transporter DctM subunit